MATQHFLVIFILLLTQKTHSHTIKSTSSPQQQAPKSTNHLQLNTSFFISNPINCTKHTCVHFYGFLPCATNVPGFVFQIVVLEYLLLVGDRILTRGRQQLFSLFDVGLYGATLFRILQVLPNIAIVVASGLAKNKEAAKVQIENGVGSLAGSTVFYLTLQWGICVVLGVRALSQESLPLQSQPSSPTPKHLLLKQKLTTLRGYKVKTDKNTSYTAGIMLLSLIPLIMVEFASSFKCQPWSHIITLTISSVALVWFFVFQYHHKWIQERSLVYSRDQLLLAGFLNHLQTFAKKKLVNDEGNADLSCIRRAFSKIDKDGNQVVSYGELREFLHNMKPEELGLEKDFAIDELMKHFDQDSNKSITVDEFIDGIQRCIDNAKQIVVQNHDLTKKYLPWLHKIIQPGDQKKAEALIKIEKQLSHVLKSAKDQQLACLLTDGKPDPDKIRSLFSESDADKDGRLTIHELRGMMMTKFKSVKLDANTLMQTLDKNNDNQLQEDEFIEGITRKLSANDDDSHLIARCIEKEKKSMEKMSLRAVAKATCRVIFGIAIVSSLVLPLIHNTQRLAESIGIPNFFVAFVVLPFAVNFKTAVANIFPASQKKENAASIMFSEIYGAVVMNNIMGLITIVGLIWARGLGWEYSAEVLVMWVIGAIIGLIAYANTSYSTWTCVLAFSLYPLSLVLYYVIRYVVGWK